MVQCFFAKAALGPGSILTVALITAASAITYLLTKRADAQRNRTTKLDMRTA